MFPTSFRLGALTPRTPALAIALLLGAGLLAGPLAAAAQTAVVPHHRIASAMKRETVEQRITSLHAALKITPAEEVNWSNVARTMRDNESAMQKLVADRNAQTPRQINAVDDLKTYERFTQAHVNGLKNLISSFETLYQAMPDTQKVVADQVFRKFGGRGS
jgi:protein CpxP